MSATTPTRGANVIDQRQVRYFEMQHRRVPQGRFFIPLADLYRRLGRLAEAEALLRDGLARHPDSVSARVVLAEVAAARGATDEALALWDEVLDRDPAHAFAAERRAALAAAPPVAPAAPGEGEADGAEADDAGPGLATPPAPGDGEEAAADGATATVPEPPAVAAPAEPQSGDVPEVFLTGTLADIYLRQGHRRKALEILRRIHERHPEREDVARRIAELERETAGEGTA